MKEFSLVKGVAILERFNYLYCESKKKSYIKIEREGIESCEEEAQKIRGYKNNNRQRYRTRIVPEPCCLMCRITLEVKERNMQELRTEEKNRIKAGYDAMPPVLFEQRFPVV